MSRKMKMGTSRRMGRDKGEKKTKTDDQSLASMEEKGIHVMANAALRKTEPISQDLVQLIPSQSENPELDTTKTKRKLGSTRRDRARQDVYELWLEEECGNKTKVCNDAAPSEAVNSELHQNASLSFEPYSHWEPAEEHFPSSLKETKSNPPYLQILLDKNTDLSSNSVVLAHSANTHAMVDSDRRTVKEEEQKSEHHRQRLQEDMLYESPIKLVTVESNMIKAESPVDRGYESCLKYDTLTQEHLDQSHSSLLGKVTLSDDTENIVSLSQIPSELLHQSEEVLSFCHQVTGPCDENEILHLADDFTDETQSMDNLEDIDADFDKQVDLTFDEPIILNPDDIYLSGQVSQEPINQKHTECTFADLSDTRNTSTNQTREEPTERNELYGNEKEERYEGFLVEDMSPHYIKRPHGQKEDIDPFSQISEAEITGRIQDSGTGYFASKVASLQALQTDSYLCHQETTTAEPLPVAGRRKMGSTRRPCRDVIVGENTEDWEKEEHIDGENNKDVMVGEGEVCHGEDRDTKVELSDGENGDKSIVEDVLTRSVTEGFDYSGNVSENQLNAFHEHDSKTSLIGDIRQPEDVLLAGADDAVLQCIYEFTDSSQTSSQYADVPFPSQSDDRLNSNVIVSDWQHNPAPNEDTLHHSRENLSYSQFPPLLGRAEENVNLEPNGTKRKRKMGSTRGNPKSRHGEEHTREGEKQDTTVPEVKDSVNIGTTHSIENIDLREYTETIREVERGGRLRGGTDTEDKDLEVIDLHQSDIKITSEEGNDNNLPKQHVSDFNNEDPTRSEKKEILKEREKQDIFQGQNEETRTTEVLNESQSNETQATTCAHIEVEYVDADDVTKNMDKALMTETWTNKEEIEDPTSYPFTVEERVKQSVDPLKLKKVANLLTVSHKDTHEEAIPISDVHTENISYQLDEAKILPMNVHDVHVSEQSLDVNVADNYLSQTENAKNVPKDSSSQKLPLDSSLCNEEIPCMNSKATKKKRKMGSTRRPCRDVIVGENTEDWEKEEHIDGENNKDVMVGEGEVCHGEDRDTKVELSDGENGDKSIGEDVLTRSVTEGFDYSGNVSENQLNAFHEHDSKTSLIGDIRQPEDVLLAGADDAVLQCIYEFTDSSQTSSQYADVPFPSQSDDRLNSNVIVSDWQHNPAPNEDTLHHSRENLSYSQFPPLLGRAEENVNLEPNGTKRKRKMGSTRGNPKSRHGEEHTREGEKQDTTVPEVKDSVNIGTTHSIENIDLREYTETIREVERGGRLRGGTDTEDKDLEVIDLHQSDIKITSEEGNDNNLPKQHVSDFNNEDTIRSKKKEILKERDKQDIFQGQNEETRTTEVLNESQSNETQATTCAHIEVEYVDADDVTKNMDKALMTETWTNKEEIEDPTSYPFTVEERVKQSVDPLKLKKVANLLTVSHKDTHEEAIPISDVHTENISYQLDEAKILPMNVHDVHVSEQSLDVNVADNYLSQTENAKNIPKDSSFQKPPLDSSLCNEETPCMNSKATKKKRKMGSTRRTCRNVIMAENSEDWQKEEHINSEKNKDVIVGEGKLCHGEDRDTKVAPELSDVENGDKNIGEDVLTRSVTEGFDYSGNVGKNQLKVFQSESKASPIGDITQPEDVLLTGAVNAAQYMYEFTDSSQTLSQYADCAMPFQSDDIPSTYSIVSEGQHNPTPYEDTLHQLTENLNSSQFPQLLGRAKEEVNVELNTSRRRKKMGSTRANPKSGHEEEHTGEGEKEDATVPKTIPEVENTVKTGTTLRTENIEFRESAETLTEEEREDQLRLVTDAKDKGLNARELNKTDGTHYKEIEDSTNDLYTAQEKMKPFGDTMMVEDPHHVLESDVANYHCSQSKDVETTPRESSHRLLSDSSLCHVGSPHTITTGKKRKMGSTRKKLQGTHEEIRKLKGDLTEPEDGPIGEQYKERENDKATERKFCHSTSIQEQTNNDSLDIVGMADNSQSKNYLGGFNKPSGVSVQLGQFEDMLSHKPAGDQDLSQSHSECLANTKDPIQNLNIDPKATGKRTKNVSSLSNSRERQDEYLRQEKQEEDTEVKEMASGVGDVKQHLATNEDHVVQNSDPLNKSHQFEDFSNANNDVENPQGKRKKMGSRRHGHGEFNNGNNRDEHWPGSTERNKDDMLHLENQTEDKGTEKVVTLDFEGNKTLLCRDGPGLRQEVGSTDFSGKTLPKQLEPTPYVGAGNTRSSAEQVEKTCEKEEVKKRIQTRQHQDTSRNRVPGQSRYNIVMVGNSNVGKTSFLNQFRSGEFCSDICASIGIDTCTQSVIVDGKTVMLQLWDTAGQERFRSITRQVFHKAQAFLLMYDITSSQSFSDVRYWVTSIQDNAIDEVIIILLGNKTDCAKRQVEPHEAESLAKEYNIYFMECSAATGDNVQQSMEIVARLMKQKVDEAEEGSMVLHKEPPVKKSSGCC
ncbi:uncharacterized protein rab44 isoform X2 [Osmerus eperlanus]|uniref:uncharacterized protein rab44 isoform X2 n=1 Tax=Osmerus eperlanus TaxID=29151 RepID=UPI002E0E96E9